MGRTSFRQYVVFPVEGHSCIAKVVDRELTKLFQLATDVSGVSGSLTAAGILRPADADVTKDYRRFSYMIPKDATYKNVLKGRGGEGTITKGLSRLSSIGVDTEKKLNEFRIDSLLGEPGITILELSEISEIQKQVRNKRLYSYLMGGKESTDNESFATEN